MRGYPIREYCGARTRSGPVRRFHPTAICIYEEWEFTPIPCGMPAALSSTHMLHAPFTSIYLGILGFSLLVAGLDFVKRRGGHRRLQATRHSLQPDFQPKIVGLQMSPIAESRAVAPIGGTTQSATHDSRRAKLTVRRLLGVDNAEPQIASKSRTPSVVRLLHQSLASGSSGTSRTLATLRSRFDTVFEYDGRSSAVLGLSRENDHRRRPCRGWSLDAVEVSGGPPERKTA
jgi:hypothetical protein